MKRPEKIHTGYPAGMTSRERMLRKRKRQRRRDAIIIAAAALVIIIVIVFAVRSCSGGREASNPAGTTTASSTTKAPATENSSTEAATTAAPETQAPTEEPTEAPTEAQTAPEGLEISRADLDSWELTLVSPDVKMAEGYEPEVREFSDGYRIDVRVYDDVRAMQNASYVDGAILFPISGYRETATQERLYNAEVQEWLDSGLSEEEARAKAGTIVAVPGTSEHQLGLSIDFCSDYESFENTEEFSWLVENAYKYGFIMRYPKDKEDITKIIYEPWHWRYVGVKHATAMRELNITTLEEYRDYLATLS